MSMTKKQKQALLLGSITQRSLCRVMRWNVGHFNKVLTCKTTCGRKKANQYREVIGGTEADWMCGTADRKAELWDKFVTQFIS